ncbi:MAG TPA: hypothetical protein DCQ20_03225 [Nitrospira sp.]|nr:hypothetical protein [Nitrospira sp.]
MEAWAEQAVMHVRTGTLPSKFVYLGRGAEEAARYEEDGYNASITRAHLATEGALLRLANWEPRGNRIFDVGPGNGSHAVALLQQIATRDDPNLRLEYIAVDISDRMANMAATRVQLAFPFARVAVLELDIEKDAPASITCHPDGGDLTLFLGHTLGNVEDVDSCLRNLRRLVMNGFVLLNCATMSSKATAADYLRPYRNSQYERGAMAPLVGLGAEPGSLSVEIEFDHDEQAVLTYVVNASPLNLSSPGGSVVVLPAGTRTRVFVSRRFCPTDLESRLVACGFRVVGRSIDDGQGAANFLLV